MDANVERMQCSKELYKELLFGSGSNVACANGTAECKTHIQHLTVCTLFNLHCNFLSFRDLAILRWGVALGGCIGEGHPGQDGAVQQEGHFGIQAKLVRVQQVSQGRH